MEVLLQWLDEIDDLVHIVRRHAGSWPPSDRPARETRPSLPLPALARADFPSP